MSDAIGKGKLNLRCRLSNIELLERQELLVKQTGKRGRLESELDAWKAVKKEEQKILEGEVTVIGAECIRLAKTIEDGEELREVDVEYQLEAQQVHTVRLDTGELVSSRPALQHEMQMQIPGAEPENEHTHRDEPEELAHEESHPDGEEPDLEDDAPPPSSVGEDELDADHEMEWGGVGGDGTKEPGDD